MSVPRIVLDTNALVAALRSRQGASFRLISLLGTGRFSTCVSVPLVVEYEAGGKRSARACGLRHSDVDDVVDYVCSISDRRLIHFLWRPVLNDVAGDMVLEVAVESGADYIVTHNRRDFSGCETFGVKALTPQQLLRIIAELP